MTQLQTRHPKSLRCRCKRRMAPPSCAGMWRSPPAAGQSTPTSTLTKRTSHAARSVRRTASFRTTLQPTHSQATRAAGYGRASALKRTASADTDPTRSYKNPIFDFDISEPGSRANTPLGATYELLTPPATRAETSA
eukprot:m.209454 g.209454  ORF g.209454 m.209454 type:complete len:137 (+) comp18983_c0_seq1:45-455(+)